ncbi:MFS transporter [Achromobacter sp. 413638]|uniref:MFS transporter n=1 Tax=Achromobacter sp. 413638 TaxID=3342385 RepID=UPI00370B1777
MPGWRVLLLAVACALSVANVYYAQPLLDAMGREFGLDEAAVGMVVTATQIGCAVALLLVVPLGDLLDRRRLMIGQLVLLMLALAAVASASGAGWLLAGMAALGLLGTAMAQGLLALSAALAAPGERGRVVGAAQGGVVIGLLLARTLSGALADLWGWRAVYLMSAALSALLAVALALGLPRRRLPSAGMGYGALLRSMYALVLTEPVLRVRGMIALLMFAAVSVFWTALVLPLSAPPHALSHTAIGAFGLVGVAGVLMAARAGRLADGGQGQRTTGAGLVLLCLSWIPLALLDWSLWALALGVLLLDVALQALHVTNQAMIFSIGAQAHSRLVGAYMLFYAAGSGLGAIAATTVYAHAGWPGVCALGAGFSAAALLFWLATLPRGVAAKPREGQCQNAAG